MMESLLAADTFGLILSFVRSKKRKVARAYGLLESRVVERENFAIPRSLPLWSHEHSQGRPVLPGEAWHHCRGGHVCNASISLFGGFRAWKKLLEFRFHVISCDLFIMFIYSVGLLGGDKGTVKNGRYQ